MDDFQKRVLEKLDKMDDRLNSVDKTLAEQHVSLKDHIRRTEILEEQVKPIEDNMTMAKGVLKFIGFGATAIGAAVAIAKGLGWL